MLPPSAQSRHVIFAGFLPVSAFTLLEFLVVLAIIAIALGFLIPSLGIGGGRSVEGAARQLIADLDGARLTAMAERTRIRILFPTNNANFAAGTSSSAWPTDIAYRGYLIVSEKRTDPRWKQRGKWSRFPTGTALDFTASAMPTPTPMPIDVGGTGSTSYIFTGPYIEFLATGSSNLDPTATPTPSAVIANGFVDSSGAFVKKGASLRYTIAVDPLSGAVSLK